MRYRCPVQPYRGCHRPITTMVSASVLAMALAGPVLAAPCAARALTGAAAPLLRPFFEILDAVKQMLPAFSIDHAYPSWPTNLWLTALLKLFRPQIEALLEHRDRVMEAWQAAHPGQDVFEDRALEITGYLPISVEDWSQALTRAQATGTRP
ncbi:hypothetical protein V2S84_17735 [Azotobacter chroococcum]|nr:hypothetical protein [Azotobacter chroococcum]